MIRIIPNAENSAAAMTFNASAAGVVVYLDNWAVCDLAEGDSNRRRRFTETLRTGRVDLLFSVTNVAELSGPQGRSADAARAFLDDVGPHWFPCELNPVEVSQRELKGTHSTCSCVCTDLVKSYLANQLRPTDASKITIVSGDYLKLGAVIEWVAPQRDSNLKGSQALDESLRNRIGAFAEEYRRDPAWLDHNWPVFYPYKPQAPATFTYHNLMRNLIREAKTFPLKKGDGLDLCHAAVGSSYANFATLDQHWKRRIEDLPKPNGLARIYDRPLLDDMIEHIELAVQAIQQQ
jgi:hypothetical protein